jgi:hypothetical protein
MSIYAEVPHLNPAYWGEEFGVHPQEKNQGVPTAFSKKVARRVLASFQAGEFTGEKQVDGTNFVPLDYDEGTIFVFDMESMKRYRGSMAGDLTADNYTGIILPTDYGKKLHIRELKPDGKMSLEPARIHAKKLIVGSTVISSDKEANDYAERVKSLEIYEDSAKAWQLQEAKLKAGFKGRILKIITK